MTKPSDNFTAATAGAVYLYNGQTGALISTLYGGLATSSIGSGGVTALIGNGNYVIKSPNWDAAGPISNVGAATWGSGTLGVAGTVSAANSLVGSIALDQVSSGGVTPLVNGHYVVSSPLCDNVAFNSGGAATWGNGGTGIAGVVDVTNSLMGGKSSDQVSSGGIIALTNGHYVVSSPIWDNGATTNVGAATWCDGTTGRSGLVAIANSLYGPGSGDQVSSGGIIALPNGHYVVASPIWNKPAPGAITDAGAATWCDGAIVTAATVTTANSLYGLTASDQVSSGGIFALNGNNNYVVSSPNWNNGIAAAKYGAATWCDGTAATVAAVATTNSLYGTTASDQISSGGITPLVASGHYVVSSPNWDGAFADVGAATWCTGAGSTAAAVGAGNSLIGSTLNDKVSYGGITALINGHYVVKSPLWNGTIGAATWCSGASATSAVVSALNSLVGSVAGDEISSGGITALAVNGNYVVASPLVDKGTGDGTGAATWGNGLGGTFGIVNTANSLMGSANTHQVSSGGIAALTNGNYVVSSPLWDGAKANVGAATWCDGTIVTATTVTTANSLHGSFTGDRTSSGGICALADGNYVVNSPQWNKWLDPTVADVGAATWGDGAIGITGEIVPATSVIGLTAMTSLGSIVADSVNGTFICPFPAESTSGIVRVGLNNPSTISFAIGTAQTMTIHPQALTYLLNQSTPVTLEASNDITIDSPVTINNPGGAGGLLTLTAGNGVFLNAD
ncbi:MAG: Cadherin protein,putative collagen-binding protein, partial [Parachlamydiales bacterium]|nr:Cadherin protein,putative collagen-binding protein [Parachlamydiales bacterium]